MMQIVLFLLLLVMVYGNIVLRLLVCTVQLLVSITTYHSTRGISVGDLYRDTLSEREGEPELEPIKVLRKMTLPGHLLHVTIHM